MEKCYISSFNHVPFSGKSVLYDQPTHVGRESVDCRLLVGQQFPRHGWSTNGRLTADLWPTNGRLTVKCWPSVGLGSDEIAALKK